MRHVYFAFDYENDIWRVNQVRNSGLLFGSKSVGFADRSLWEKAKTKRRQALERLILERRFHIVDSIYAGLSRGHMVVPFFSDSRDAMAHGCATHLAVHCCCGNRSMGAKDTSKSCRATGASRRSFHFPRRGAQSPCYIALRP